MKFSLDKAFIEKSWRETVASIGTQQMDNQPEKIVGKVIISIPFDFEKFVSRMEREIMESDSVPQMQDIVFKYLLTNLGWHKEQALAAYPNMDFIEMHFDSDQDAMLWKLANVGAA